MTITTTVEVEDFVTAVAAQLADLAPEDRQELLDGLQADLEDLVAERGSGALGDPGEYARELRTAAGLSPEMAPVRQKLSLGTRWLELLDRARHRALGWIDGLPGDLGGLLRALRPGWWVVRAWLASMLIGGLFERDSSIGVLPLAESPVMGILLLAGCIVGSVQIGRGAWWPGNRSKVGPRTLLLGLNAFAVAVLMPMISAHSFTWGNVSDQSYVESFDTTGLRFNGEPIRNIFPYDAAGHPLVGVQLLDQRGKPLDLSEGSEREGGRVMTFDPDGSSGKLLGPWLNGQTTVYSVFPLGETTLDDNWEPFGEMYLPEPPLATLPAVTLLGVEPSVIAPKGEDPVKPKKKRAKNG